MFMNNQFRGIHTHMMKQMLMYMMIFSVKMVVNSKEWILTKKWFQMKKKVQFVFVAVDVMLNILLVNNGKIIKCLIFRFGRGASIA